MYIGLALLAVHTNLKRFQCERPREKRATLRERNDALGTRSTYSEVIAICKSTINYASVCRFNFPAH